MLAVGNREEEQGTVAVRSRGAGDEGVQPLDAFAKRVAREIAVRR